jgi:flagellar biosynthesis protein FlhG
MVNAMGHNVSFKLVINRVTDFREGKQTADKINLVAKQFLHIDIPSLGFVDDDSSVSKAVKKQVPFTIAFPNSAASRSMHSIVKRYMMGIELSDASPPTGVKGFLNKMMKLLK